MNNSHAHCCHPQEGGVYSIETSCQDCLALRSLCSLMEVVGEGFGSLAPSVDQLAILASYSHTSRTKHITILTFHISFFLFSLNLN